MFYAILLAHCVATAFALKLLNFVLPCFLTSYYACTANLLLYVLIAKFTFVFTKRRYLGDDVQPENKAVLITGCDTGFGNALARRLDGKGFHVFASCLFPDGPGAAELKVSCSKRLQVFGMDVTKDQSVQDSVQYVKENLGISELWALVNNAGIYRGITIELTGMEDFKACMEVNAFGPVRVTKAFLPLLRKSKGRVVNLTSAAGRLSFPHVSPYTMSKYAETAFNDCLRHEMRVWGIRVVSVEPELFQTKITDHNLVVQSLDKTFSTVGDDVKSDYGERHLKSVRSWVDSKLQLGSPKIHKVVDSLDAAVCKEHPDITYRPSRNTLFRVAIYFLESMPYALQDWILRLMLFVGGFPKPEEDKN